MTKRQVATKKWMEDNRLYPSKMAKELHTTYVTVHRWIQGKQISPIYKELIAARWPACPLLDEHY